MSWVYTSKALVNANYQIPTADLTDAQCDWVEKLIDDRTRTTFTGVTTYTNEAHDGDGNGILTVDHPPIVSVTSLSVDDSVLDTSNYKVYDSWVQLVTTQMTDVSESLATDENIFPKGEQNVTITYVGGSATVPKNVQLAATQMVATLALVTKREGSDASLKYSRVTRNDGDASTTTETFGLQNSLLDIMKKYIPKGLVFR